MKHFRKIHGLNISLTFLAVFLAMGGLFLINNGLTLGALTPGDTDGECGLAVNGQYVTGVANTGILCDVGALSEVRPGTDFTGTDGTFNRTCEGVGFGYSVQCSAKKYSLGNTSITGSTASGESVDMSGNVFVIYSQDSGATGTLTVSGMDSIEVIGGTWDGTLTPPTLVTGANAATGGETGIGTGTAMLLTIEAGATGGTSLQASGGYFTVQFVVSAGYVGQNLKIFRSQNGSTRTLNTPDNDCTLDIGLRCTFHTDHLSYFSVGSIIWNNFNYLSPTFRSAGPTNGEIVAALYGTGGGQTAYTQNRSGRNGSQCNLTGMTVTYLTGGTNTIPHQLTGNTIYVLNSGNYIMTGIIKFSGCNAIIGSGTVRISSTTGLDASFLISGYNNAIIDNISQNGWYGSSSLVRDGIKIYSGKNITINNAEFTNNGYSTGGGITSGGQLPEPPPMECGINVENSMYTTISNTKVSNDLQQGIFFNNSEYNTLNNIQTYNNKYHGLYVTFSDHNTFNNVQSYNNDSYGMLFDHSDYNTFNNIESYNNSTYGLRLMYSDYNTINNFLGYNNAAYGISLTSSTGNQYFGTLSIFGNVFNTTTFSGLTAGGTTYSSLGRIAGTVNTGTLLSRGHITNPHNNGGYLLDRIQGYASYRGQFTGRSSTAYPIIYSIGGYTPLQTQPVKWNGGTLALYGLSGTSASTGGADRYPSYYIGHSITALTGNMTLSSAYVTFNGQMYTTTGNLTLNILSTASSYTLGGGFTGSPRVGAFSAGTNISTGVTTVGDGLKAIVLQLSTGNNRATHYGFNVIVDTITPTFTATALPATSVVSGGYYSTTGVTINYSDANFSGATLAFSGGVTTTYSGGTSGTITIPTDATYTFTISDYVGHSTGITFTIDDTYPIISGSTNTGLTIASGGVYAVDSITLQFLEANFSGATLYKDSVLTNSYTTAPASIQLTQEGIYNLSVTDKANNTTTTMFALIKALSGQLILSGGAMVQNVGVRYTAGQASILLRSNKTGTVTVTGEFSTLGGSFTAAINANQWLSYTLSMTGGEGARFIYATFTGYSSISGIQSLPLSKGVIVDLTGPVITNTYPNNGQTGLSGNVLFGRSGPDAGVGTSGYYYYVSMTGTFATYAFTGYTTGSTITIPYYNFLSSGTYYRKIQGVDKLGNRGLTGETRSFDYSATVDAEPDSFSFDAETDADINTAYMSETITITGLTANVEVPVSIDNGVLYISGIVVGRTGTVKQGSTVKIELISSSEYDETVTSTLTIGSLTPKFRITTMNEEDAEDTTLSTSSKLNIVTVFDTIADLYEDNKSKQNEFMIIFKSMLEDMIEELEDEDNLSSSEERKLAVLEYLLDLTEEFIDDNDISDGDIHTAPNGRVYVVVFDDDKACYTSPNFLSANKCFPSLAAMKSYIDINNQAWNHTVDTSRAAVIHKAPNNKMYTVYKTTGSKYFSYRFISPKYFNSLTEIKTYIDKNNPKGKGR